jgi:membrane-bound lytic murein transglycosylase D
MSGYLGLLELVIADPPMTRLLSALLMLATVGFSSPAAAIDESVAIFPRPPELAPAVSFWTRVFGEYSEHQLVIHAMDHPNKVFAVLDYRGAAAEGENPVTLRRRQREDTQATINHINEVLRRVAASPNNPERLDDEARAVRELFADLNDPGVYARTVGRVRAQRGLAERTRTALVSAGRYMPYMKQVFAEEGLPVALTRLPLVESSFDNRAYSKVGAAGIWQFMPGTARRYMRLDDLVDDRRDPWFSTHAAARHLSDDYAMLQDWPLAVTAYNFGRVGIRRALDEIGGNTLVDMINRYEGRRFGFASRNFYAEFLAALDVERAHPEWFGPVIPAERLIFDTVTTRDYVAWSTLQQLSGLSTEAFHERNPAYVDLVREDKLLVPPGHLIRVAPGHAGNFEAAYAQLGASHRHAQQRSWLIEHRVRAGETLSQIARRHGTSAARLQEMNGIRDAGRIRIGQIIKVPPRDAPAQVARVSLPGPVASVSMEAPYTLHRINQGETLSAIGRRHGLSPQALAQFNGLGNHHNIRAGALLKIPVAANN